MVRNESEDALAPFDAEVERLEESRLRRIFEGALPSMRPLVQDRNRVMVQRVLNEVLKGK